MKTKHGLKLGQIVITADASNTLDIESIIRALRCHMNYNWGDTCQADWILNDKSVKDGGRILSVFHDAKENQFWIITEADRSVTTVLLPEDY